MPHHGVVCHVTGYASAGFCSYVRAALICCVPISRGSPGSRLPCRSEAQTRARARAREASPRPRVRSLTNGNKRRARELEEKGLLVARSFPRAHAFGGTVTANPSIASVFSWRWWCERSERLLSRPALSRLYVGARGVPDQAWPKGSRTPRSDLPFLVSCQTHPSARWLNAPNNIPFLPSTFTSSSVRFLQEPFVGESCI